MSAVPRRSPIATKRCIPTVIIDDHPITREGIARLLTCVAEVKICGEAGSVAEGRRVCQATAPELVILDINLPDGSGLEAVKWIRRGNEKLKVLVFSCHEVELFAERARQSGAVGYINKIDAVAQVVEAVQTVVSGSTYWPESMGRRESEAPASAIANLTPREMEVFQLYGTGARSRTIAAQLGVSPKTIDRHRENIRAKLNLRYGTDLIRVAAAWVLQHPRGDR